MRYAEYVRDPHLVGGPTQRDLSRWADEIEWRCRVLDAPNVELSWPDRAAVRAEIEGRRAAIAKATGRRHHV